MKLAKQISKTPVLSRVCDGFIANRMLAPYGLETMYLVEEGAAPQDVDRVMERFGFPMGPFRMFDLAGLDAGGANQEFESTLELQGDLPSPGSDVISAAAKIVEAGLRVGDAGPQHHADRPEVADRQEQQQRQTVDQ